MGNDERKTSDEQGNFSAIIAILLHKRLTKGIYSLL